MESSFSFNSWCKSRIWCSFRCRSSSAYMTSILSYIFTYFQRWKYQSNFTILIFFPNPFIPSLVPIFKFEFVRSFTFWIDASKSSTSRLRDWFSPSNFLFLCSNARLLSSSSARLSFAPLKGIICWLRSFGLMEYSYNMHYDNWKFVNSNLVDILQLSKTLNTLIFLASHQTL